MSTEPAPRRTNLALRVLRLVAVAYLLVLLLMTMLERYLVYPAPPLSRGDWAPAGDDYEDVWIDVPALKPSGEPTRVHGWYFDHPEPLDAVLYCHGNGEDITFNLDLARHLRDELEAAVLLFDYRGYGKSVGKPHEAGLVADGLAAQRWLAERTARTPDQTVVIGRSLGGGVATAIAAEQGAQALVLQSTFSRMTDAAASHYPWLPVRWIMQNRYDSLARLAAYDGPVLISHGDWDEVIPYEQGVRLFDTAPGKKRFVELPGRSHNQPQPGSYYPVLQEFLAESRIPLADTALNGEATPSPAANPNE
ncbi:Alpha/beta hydrolase family protein [Planctomycetes bacterium MalM25]|nr:Alpha/beta hydrolase family protein [Planctomycetes bacterium MalM25]